jgi:hypothetical protein
VVRIPYFRKSFYEKIDFVFVINDDWLCAEQSGSSAGWRNFKSGRFEYFEESGKKI